MHDVRQADLHTRSFGEFLERRLPVLVRDTLRSQAADGFRATGVEIVLPWGSDTEWRLKGQSFTASVLVDVQWAEDSPCQLCLFDLPLLTPGGTFIRRGLERVPLAQLRRRPGVFLSRWLGAAGLPVVAASIVDGHRERFGYHLALDGRGMPAGCDVFGAGADTMDLAAYLGALGLGARASSLFGESLAPLLGSGEGRATVQVDCRVSLDDDIRCEVDERLEEVRRALSLGPGGGADITDDDALALLGFVLAAAEVPKLPQGLSCPALDDPSDLDHERVWLVGDHLEETWRLSLPDLHRVVDAEAAAFVRVAGRAHERRRPVAMERRLSGILRAAFDRYLTSSLCPPLDRLNPLAEVSHKRAVTRLGPGAVQSRKGHVAQRHVHPSHYGRLCLLETPESDAIGLRLQLAACGGVDERGKLTEALREDGADPAGALGLSAALVPFIGHDDLVRAGMGVKNMKQAVPLLSPEPPLVATGAERLVAQLAGHGVRSPGAGRVTHVTADTVTVGGETVAVPAPEAGHLGTCYEWRCRVVEGQELSVGDLLADGPACLDGELALGVNLLVAYVAYDGANFEDGVVVSDRLVREGLLTSRHRWEYSVVIPGDEERLDYEHQLGRTIHEGHVLVRTIWLGAPGQPPSPRSHCLDKPMSGSLVAVRIDELSSPGDPDASRVSERLTFVIEQERPLAVGDKLTGRHGNKGVVTRIDPCERMPRLADGTPIDVLLNPHGVVSRMNLGQLLETHWGWAAGQLGCRFEAAPFRRVALKACIDPTVRDAVQEAIHEADDDETALRSVLAIAAEHGQRRVDALGDAGEKVALFDPRTDQWMEQPVTVGWQYFFKLNHLAADKVHVRDVGEVSRLTMQPVGGRRRGGGQRFGEMEVWGLVAHHVPALLKEALGLRADDVIAAQSVGTVVEQGAYDPAIPESLRALAMLLRGLLVNLEYQTEDGNWSDRWEFLSTARAGTMKAFRVGLADPRQVESWAIDFDVTEPAALNRVVQHYCPLHGWWEPATTHRDVVARWRAIVERSTTGEHDGARRAASHASETALDAALRRADRDYRASQRCPGRSGQGQRCAQKPERTRTVWAFARAGLFSPDRLPLEQAVPWRQVMGRIPLSETLANPLWARWGDLTGIGVDRRVLLDIVRWRKVWDLPNRQFVEWDHVAEREAVAPGTCLGGWDLLKHLASPEDAGASPESAAGERVLSGARVTVVPVVPADFRAVEFSGDGPPRLSDLHRLYAALVQANQKLLKLRESTGSSPLMVLAAKRQLQRSLNALLVDGIGARGRGDRVRSLADLLQGKTGLIRQALLGKRVNYSGRAVIVGDPALGIDECRIPAAMKPLLERSARPEDPQEPDARLVLLNRAPTLHRSNVMALTAREWEHDAIGLPPLVCGPFNADFDGDTMSVHVPLLTTGRREADEKMRPSRHVLSAANGGVQLHLTQDIVSGAWLAARPPLSNEAASLLRELGFSEASRLDKRRLVQGVAERARRYGSEDAARLAEAVARMGFERLTRWGLSLSVFDVPLMPRQIRERLFAESGMAGVEAWCADALTARGEEHPLAIMVLSGARGTVSTLAQLGGMRGPMKGPGGTQPVPVLSNFREGLSPADFLASSFGARKTLMDKKLVTADAGYLTRQLIEAVYPQVITDEDCGDTEGIEVRDFRRVLDPADPAAEAEHRAPSLATRLAGRVLLGGHGTGTSEQLLDERAAAALATSLAEDGASVSIRSPLTCKAPSGVCQRCYGWDPSTRRFPEAGLPVGVLAGQSIGERGTQLTMRTFHGGGVEVEDITSGLPRVRQLLSGTVGVRQLDPRPPSGGSQLEWRVRWEGRSTNMSVVRDDRGRPALVEVDLKHWLGDTALLWHGFHWEMSQVYGDGVDGRHFEIVLKSLIAAASRGIRGNWLRAAIEASGGPRHFLAGAGFESGVEVLIKAAVGRCEDALVSPKSRVMTLTG